MKTRQVRWFEGMLVLPHHFQAAEANSLDWLSTAQNWLNPYAYGIASLDLNRAALANYEVRIPRIEARFRDGTLASVPENGYLPTLDLKPAFGESDEIYVHLLLPEVIPGRRNSTHEKEEDADLRYLAIPEEWEEQNSGSNRRTIDFHYLNCKLKAQPTRVSPSGFESLPLLKLRRSREAGAAPEIDDSYIPPLLACNAWPFLQDNILLAINAQLGAYITKQSHTLRIDGGWSEATLPQVHRGIVQLQAVNSSYPYLVQLFHALRLHPFLAYTELCRLVGQLSIVRSDWQPPELPAYDHDDLGRIFAAIKIEIDAILSAKGPLPRVERYPFIGTGNWMQVGFDESWFQPGHEFFVGIRSQLPPDKLESLFADSHLDWKLGSSQSIQRIYQNAEAGLSVRRYPGRHPSLPVLRDVTYFLIESQGPYWHELVEHPDLALKVNNRFVIGDSTGKNSMIVVDPDGEENVLSADLYVVINA